MYKYFYNVVLILHRIAFACSHSEHQSEGEGRTGFAIFGMSSKRTATGQAYRLVALYARTVQGVGRLCVSLYNILASLLRLNCLSSSVTAMTKVCQRWLTGSNIGG